jgi:hypothetical protein
LALVKASSLVYGQGQARIKQVYQAYGQANTKIILTALKVYAQSLAHIRITNQVWAQGNSYIKSTGNNAYAQAPVWIKQTYPFGGGSTIIGQDSFTESTGTVALTSHTPEVGAWSQTYIYRSGLAGATLTGPRINSSTDRVDAGALSYAPPYGTQSLENIVESKRFCFKQSIINKVFFLFFYFFQLLIV